MNLKNVYLVQLDLRRESEPVDRVRPDVRPLTELLRRLCESHVRRDGRVDNSLKWHEIFMRGLHKLGGQVS